SLVMDRTEIRRKVRHLHYQISENHAHRPQRGEVHADPSSAGNPTVDGWTETGSPLTLQVVQERSPARKVTRRKFEAVADSKFSGNICTHRPAVRSSDLRRDRKQNRRAAPSY